MNLITNFKQLFRSTKLVAVITGFLLIAYAGVSQQQALAASTCDPDPANPLKCFCEEVRTDIDNAVKSGKVSKENKDICQLNDIDQDRASKEGLLAENGIIKKVFNLLSWITGLLAAVYLIVGGAKIITSGGNSDKVTSGRKMIIYALVGIAVVISSNLIINFVIGLVNDAST